MAFLQARWSQVSERPPDVEAHRVQPEERSQEKEMRHDCERLAECAVQGVTGELNDGHEEITEHQAGDMMSLATPVQNVMRGWQQPTGGQRGCQEYCANDEAHRVQGESDVGWLNYGPLRSVLGTREDLGHVVQFLDPLNTKLTSG